MPKMKTMTINGKTYEIDDGDSVSYGVAQNLSGDQKKIARQNIGAIAFEDLPTDASPIVCQASGEVLAVADSSDRLLQGLRVFGRTVQDGTPSPDAPVELVSVGDSGAINTIVAGKNLLKTPLTRRYKGFSFAEAFPVKSGVEYTLSFSIENATSWRVAAVLYDENGTLISDANNAYTDRMQIYTDSGLAIPHYYSGNDGVYISGINRTENAFRYIFDQDYYVVFGIHYGDTSDTTVITDSQFEVGTTVTSYEPYNAQALTVSTPNGLPGIPVTSGGNYTDASGQQWICDEVDFARGVYVQRVETRELQSNSWRMDGTLDANNWKFGLNVGTQVIRGAIASDHFRHMSSVAVGHAQGNGIYIWENGYMEVVSPNHTTAEAFRQWNWDNPIVIMYALATPTETPLDADTLAAYTALHTNKPNTTVHNDGGAHMELSYVADTKLYIDQKLAAISAAVLNK